MHTCTHIYIYKYINIFVQSYVYICMYIYTCIILHTSEDHPPRKHITTFDMFAKPGLACNGPTSRQKA